MNDLLCKYNDYLRLKNCRAEYLFSNEEKIDFTYKEENFIHLIGLHKLTDIQLIQLFNDKKNRKVQTRYIISRIKKELFTDAVLHFNPALINSKLQSDYLLFEQSTNHEYNHLGIAKDPKTNIRYVETFFHQTSDMYIQGQETVKIKRFTLYAPDNQIIVSDSFLPFSGKTYTR